MRNEQKHLRTCTRGQHYFKSSDCPTFPICEAIRTPESDFLSLLSAPARRALEREGILTAHQLSLKSQSEILKLHGMGPASLPKLKSALLAEGLNLRSSGGNNSFHLRKIKMIAVLCHEALRNRS
ncbi:MAG: hypothetical protein H7Y13_17815 [Sphingobacteriaceae bacterium]|nr:hypothetical protein [Sphingobacteriaceae bacterium]